jgi:hypothetical protein
MREFIARAGALLATVAFSVWAILIGLSNWIGRSTVVEDYNQLVDRLPAVAAWLLATPWWVPGAGAIALTTFLIWVGWPTGAGVSSSLWRPRVEKYQVTGRRAIAVAHHINKQLRFRLDPPGPIMAEAIAVMIQLNKLGIEVPSLPADADVQQSMLLAHNYLSIIGPVLRDGQINEARQIAKQMTADANSAEAQRFQ